MMKTKSRTVSASVPKPIVEKLERLIRRVRLVMFFRGVLAVAAVAAGTLLAVMAVNESVPTLADWPGWVLTSSALALSVLAAIVFLVRPVMRSFTLPGIARAIERRHPELQERLSSAVELLTSTDAPELRGSDVLIGALVREAVFDANQVTPRREISMRSLRPFLAAAGATLGILAMLFVVWPGPTARALTRAVLPGAGLGNVFSSQLEVKPGDTTIIIGTPLTVNVRIANKRVDGAELQLIGPDGSRDVHRMTMLPAGADGWPRFEFTCPPAKTGYRYRVEAGSAVSRVFRVAVVPQPTIKRIDVRYDFPKYMNRRERTDTDVPGDIREKVGVTAAVRAYTNTRIATGELILAGKSEPVKIETDSNGRTVCAFKIRMTPKLRGTWRLKLTDTHGFENRVDNRIVEAIADTPPKVKIVNLPAGQLKLRPSARLPIIYTAEDDFGIRDMQFILTADGRKLPPVPVELPQTSGTRRRRLAGKAILDFAGLDLKGVRRLTFRLRAADVLPGKMNGPQYGWSDLYNVQFDVQAPSYPEQVLMAEELLVRQALKKILKDLQAAKVDSSRLEKIIPKLPKLTPSVTDRIDHMRKLVSSADAAVRDLMGQLAGGTYEELLPKLAELADKHTSVAGSCAGRIVLTDSQRQRARLADETDYQIGRSIDLVKEMLENMDKTTEAIKRAIELEDLAARQDELAKASDVMKGVDDAGAKLDEGQWKRKQKNVASDIGGLIKSDPSARRFQAVKDNATARDLAGEAQRLSKAQSGVARDTKRAGKFAELEAERRKLAAEQKALAARAAARKTAVDESKKMAQAGEDIQAGRLGEAIGKQSQAEVALTGKARRIQQHVSRQRRSLNQLASLAERIASRQKQVADSAGKAKGDPAKLLAIRRGLKTTAAAALRLAQARRQLSLRHQKISAEQQQLARQMAAIGKRKNELDAQASDLASRRKRLAARMDQAKGNPAGLAELDKLKRQLDSQAGDLTKERKDLAEQVSQLTNHKRETDARAGDIAGKQDEANRASAQVDRQRRELSRQLRSATPKPSLAAGLAKWQKQLAAQARTLTKQAAEIPQIARAVLKHDPSPEMNRAAQAMAGRRLPQAAQSAAKARDEAVRLAKALREAEREMAKNTPASLKQAKTIGELAHRQSELRRKTEDLNRRQAALDKTQNLLELARLRKAQSQLAREVGKLVDDVKENAPQPDRIDTAAARAARESAGALRQSKVSQAARKASEASSALGELARRMGAQPVPRSEPGKGKQAGESQPRKPSGEAVEAKGSTQQEPDQLAGSGGKIEEKKELGRQAAGLATRQQRLADQMKALAENKPADLAASRQEDIAERTQSLAKATELVRVHTGDLSPNPAALAEAQKAAGEIAKALAAQQRARGAMKAGRTTRAIPSQQRSAEALASAAKAMERLGNMLAAEANGKQANQGAAKADDSEDLAAAYEAANQAAAGEVSEAQLAARLLGQLARGASAQLKQMGVQLSQAMTFQPMGNPDSLSGLGVGLMTADLSTVQLEKLGISLGDWARLPGELKSQILQASADVGLREYRVLIKRYFSAIARRSEWKAGEKRK